MLILTIRTDKPEAEIGLFDNEQRLAYEAWPAHRQLAETIHTKIKQLLDSQNRDWSDIGAVGCFEGPGSFTGLRIGLSVANALASSLNVPIASATGIDWINDVVGKLVSGADQKIIKPYYGSAAHITAPKK